MVNGQNLHPAMRATEQATERPGKRRRAPSDQASGILRALTRGTKGLHPCPTQRLLQPLLPRPLSPGLTTPCSGPQDIRPCLQPPSGNLCGWGLWPLPSPGKQPPDARARALSAGSGRAPASPPLALPPATAGRQAHPDAASPPTQGFPRLPGHTRPAPLTHSPASPRPVDLEETHSPQGKVTIQAHRRLAPRPLRPPAARAPKHSCAGAQRPDSALGAAAPAAILLGASLRP